MQDKNKTKGQLLNELRELRRRVNDCRNNQQISVHEIIGDISGFKQSETLVVSQNSDACFRSIFDESPVGEVIVDQDLRFCRVNHSFCQLTGNAVDLRKLLRAAVC
jgi:PAS domain-containing protein